MKKYILFSLLVVIAKVTFAQYVIQEVVYLGDASITYDEIKYQFSNNPIAEEPVDSNLIGDQIDLFKELAKTPYLAIGSTAINEGLQRGYKGIIELGYQAATSRYGIDAFKLNIINGYQLNPYFSLGIGTGLRYYFKDKIALIPVFADFRVNFIDNKVSPYLSLGAGYSFGKGFEGVSFIINPTIGASFKVSDKSAMIVGIGYEIQKIDHYSSSSGAISLNVGVSF